MKAKIFYAATFTSLTNQINKSGAALRVDCHFNASGSRDPNCSLVEIREGDVRSAQIGQLLARKTAEKLRIDNSGIKELRSGQRGYPIVRGMNCPTVLWEPCFCSNPAGADAIKNKRNLLHDAFLETINHHLPPNALIALVPGHAHKRRGDPGASVLGGGTEGYYTELLVKELFSLINSQPAQSGGDKELFTVQSLKPVEDFWVEGLFTSGPSRRYDYGRGDVWINLRTDEEKKKSKVRLYICSNKYGVKELDITTLSDNVPLAYPMEKDLGGFGIHFKVIEGPAVVIAVNQH